VWLQQLSIENCRLIEQSQLALAKQANVFIGDNGSGKSSLIEALCILSRGRSFRSPRIREVIRQGADTLTVTGRIYDQASDRLYPIGISKNGQKTRIRINHGDVQQQAELSRHLPLTVMHTDTVDLISGSPVQRRALLDWIAFYREKEFHNDWRNYQRILKQRNVCLREPQQHYALSYWTEQFVLLQPRILQYRQRALQALQTALQQVEAMLARTGALSFALQTGLPAQLDAANSEALLAYLREKEQQEKRYGASLYGAHRSDLQVFLNGQMAAKTASRGQLKLLGIALLLAQSMAIAHDDTNRGIIAFDDLASELDSDNQQLLYQVLQSTQQQLIITGTRLPALNDLPKETRLFHVKQGQFHEAIGEHI